MGCYQSFCLLVECLEQVFLSIPQLSDNFGLPPPQHQLLNFHKVNKINVDDIMSSLLWWCSQYPRGFRLRNLLCITRTLQPESVLSNNLYSSLAAL